MKQTKTLKSIKVSDREVRKEMKEHPWMSKTQATRLCRDHAIHKKGFLYSVYKGVFEKKPQTKTKAQRKGSKKRGSFEKSLEKALGDLI